MGCAASVPQQDEFQDVSVPELAGAWVPTRIDEWVGCPAPRDHRVQTYLYMVNVDGSWYDVAWRHAPRGIIHQEQSRAEQSPA